ncbi:hypothetical protein BDF20DRAFT_1003168 [Mycotypha africana]|uniref:uncharacterized protein n=1 Tax=Mycotypha africana TaxID=64632 RepID=UPI0023008F73|nr:uncharacterized protein BDF20DRAFT_1003168 [Mycotypha africana]KAI8971989.1 hypothetical protein BDF20DRAFT_1003168 [Mycotypha africana]
MPNKEEGNSFAQYTSGNINMNSYFTPQLPPSFNDKHQFNRYTSPINQQQQQPSRQQQRRYATREESEATVPVFTTPTDMYIRRELNPIPRFTSSQPLHSYNNRESTTPSTSTLPSPSTQQAYSTPKSQPRTNYNSFLPSSHSSHLYKDAASSAFDPLSKEYPSVRPTSPISFGSKVPLPKVESLHANSSKNGTPGRSNYANTTSSSSVQSNGISTDDKVFAQLVDMGFDVEAIKVAMIASKNGDFQEILDTLLQNATTPAPSKEKAYANEHMAPAQSDPNSADVSSDEEEDPAVLRAQEEQWRKEREKRRKGYLAQIRRNKPIPPTPNSGNRSSNDHWNDKQHDTPYVAFPPPPPPPHAQSQPTSAKMSSHSTTSSSSHVSTPPPPPHTDPLTDYADKERKEGNYLFNHGQFAEAEVAYTLAIQSLPADHSNSVLLYNNRAAARLKQGKFQDCLLDCTLAIDLAHKHINSNTSPSKIMSATNTSMKSQLLKSLHRKACALEGLHSFETAFQVYEEYRTINGEESPLAVQGIKRCQQAMQNGSSVNNAKWKPSSPSSTTANQSSTNSSATAFPDIDFNMFMPPKKAHLTDAELEEINNSKAVKAMRDREKQKEAEEAERLEKDNKVNSQITIWKAGKEKNLRALLSSLDMILWTDVQWKNVTMSDLIEPRKCKITYMKAIAKVHPDKLPATATVEQHTNEFGNPNFNAKAWINSILKPSTLSTPTTPVSESNKELSITSTTSDEIADEDRGAAKNTTILVTKLQLTGETISRQFDQVSSSLIHAMPRVLYDIKVITDQARSTYENLQSVKKSLRSFEEDNAEAIIEQLRRPHIAKQRMEECRMLLLEKSDHLNKIKEEQERKRKAEAEAAEVEARAKALAEEETEKERQRELLLAAEKEEERIRLEEEEEIKRKENEQAQEDERVKKEEKERLRREKGEEEAARLKAEEEQKTIDEVEEYGHVQLPPLRQPTPRQRVSQSATATAKTQKDEGNSYLQQISESVSPQVSNVFKKIGVPLDKFWQ